MRVDNIRKITATKQGVRKLRASCSGSYTVSHSHWKFAGIWPDGTCRALTFGGKDDSRLRFLSLSAKTKRERVVVLTYHRHDNLARIHARRLP